MCESSVLKSQKHEEQPKPNVLEAYKLENCNYYKIR